MALAARSLQRRLAADPLNRPSQPTAAGPRNNGTGPDPRPTVSLTTKGRSGSVGNRTPLGAGAAVCSGVEALLRHSERSLRRAVEVGEAVNKLRCHTLRRPSVTPVEDVGFELLRLARHAAAWAISRGFLSGLSLGNGRE
jgi:hypothetical protein